MGTGRLLHNVCLSVIVPLCRKILNDLSSDVPAVPRIEEEKSEDDSAPAITTVTMPTPIYQTTSGQYSKSLWLKSLCNNVTVLRLLKSLGNKKHANTGPAVVI